jgi:hypothetical protein
VKLSTALRALLKEKGEMKFRKKSVVIDAVQWTGSNLADMTRFIECDFSASQRACGDGLDSLFIPTREGEHEARPGDWIIRGIAGEFYPCKPDIFAATFEPVSTESDESREAR